MPYYNLVKPLKSKLLNRLSIDTKRKQFQQLTFYDSGLDYGTAMYVPEILGLKSKLFRKWPLIQNGPPITLLRVCGLSFVLKLAAMYFCEPEYDMTYLYVYTVTKNTCQTVTVRFFE